MNKKRGFTLLEMLIVLVVIAVLAAFAFPSYQGYVRKAKRADAMDALLTIQNLQEKWRANNPEYSNDLAEIGYGESGDSMEGYYSVAIVAGSTATKYVITATAQGDQASDRAGGTSCTALTITVDAANPRGDKTPVECW